MRAIRQAARDLSNLGTALENNDLQGDYTANLSMLVNYYFRFLAALWLIIIAGALL